MREGDYFYSNPTSLNIHICSFIIHDKKRSNIVMVKLRNANGSFCEGVKVRDMGATISPDYLNVGYRFVGVKPIAIIESNFLFT